jgi:hypothetical protein
MFCPAGSTGFTLCPSGLYCPSISNQSTCPAGSYCPTGSTSPSACNTTSGVYCGAGSSSQGICSLGSYCPNMTVQFLCPAGQYCSATGLTAPSGTCVAGYFCAIGSRSATGATANSSGTKYPYFQPFLFSHRLIIFVFFRICLCSCW